MVSVETILAGLACTSWSYELILVDDVSDDDTREVISSVVERYPTRVRALLHGRNTGRGQAVKDGFEQAIGAIVGYVDADLEVHARYIVPCVLEILGGADVACAHRIYRLQPKLYHRHVLSRGYASMVQALLGLGLADTESGFKFFRREKLMQVLGQTRDMGWFWDTEIMAHCRAAGFKISEVPALFMRREDKKSTVRVWRDSAVYVVKLLAFRNSEAWKTLRRSRGSVV